MGTNAVAVAIGYMSHSYHIRKERLEEVLALLQQCEVCRICEQHFTQEWPKVAGNICLFCLEDRKKHGLQYLGPDKDDQEMHLFLAKGGTIYTSKAGPGKPEKADENNLAGLKYYRFAVPDHAVINNKEQHIQGCFTTLYGRLAHDQIVLMHAWEKHPEAWSVHFIISKERYVQINMRKKSHQQAFAIARKRSSHEYQALLEILNEDAALRRSVGLEEQQQLEASQLFFTLT